MQLVIDFVKGEFVLMTSSVPVFWNRSPLKYFTSRYVASFGQLLCTYRYLHSTTLPTKCITWRKTTITLLDIYRLIL